MRDRTNDRPIQSISKEEIAKYPLISPEGLVSSLAAGFNLKSRMMYCPLCKYRIEIDTFNVQCNECKSYMITIVE